MPLANPLSATLLATLLLAPALARAAEPACTTTPADQQAVTETIRTMYAAASTDDLAKFHSVTTPDFIAFDLGQRFPGDAIMTMVKSAHTAGKVIVWSVNQPDVHITCNTAWIAYTNRGSLTDASGTVPLTWLESAFLQKEAGTWKIVFFHSTRVPPPPA